VLTLKLKAGESLLLGDDIRIIVRGDAGKGRVTIGVDAPREIAIARIDAHTTAQVKHNM